MKTGTNLFFIAVVMMAAATSRVCFASDDDDFQYWSTAEFSFDLNEDWGFVFQEELRLEDSASRLYHHYSDAGFVYKGLADWIDLGVNFRLVYEKDSAGEWRQENRPHLNVNLKGKLFGLDVSGRSRFEYRDRENKDDVWRYRNKFTVKLPFELTALKLKPYVADEVFVTLNDDNIDRNRLFGGVVFKLAENLKADVYYMWQSNRGAGDWIDTHVLGTAMKFSF
ncbi:MAG: DUF2490 domain-containing protein [Sedimentisphaerales bacterium]|nr:DUF2490 domain-containing protein [Sedimentisphaerales bacterium]